MSNIGVVREYLRCPAEAWDTSRLELPFAAIPRNAGRTPSVEVQPTAFAAVALLCTPEFARSPDSTDLARYVLFACLPSWSSVEVQVVLTCVAARFGDFPPPLQNELSRWVGNCVEHLRATWCLELFLRIAGTDQRGHVEWVSRLLHARLADADDHLAAAVSQWLARTG